jgi:hypothetical protein
VLVDAEPKPDRPRWKGALVKASPSRALAALFLLGFLGRPENNYWRNRSHLWGSGDPFCEDADERFVAHPTTIWRGRTTTRGRPSTSSEGRATRVIADKERGLDVEWVVLPTVFTREDLELGGSVLFNDWVHPNVRGNRAIAEAVVGKPGT